MKKNTLILLVAIGLLVVGATGGAWWLLGRRTTNSEVVRLDIAAGDFPSLCDSLSHRGIRPTAAMRLFARVLGLEEHVRPGSYLVQPHMRQLDLVRKLRNGQQDPIRLTIGRFRTPDQLNRYLATHLMHDDFNVTLDNFHLVLPDTYEVYWTISPEAFRRRMEEEYERYFRGQGAWGLTPREVVILASIVEEETNHETEKPLIASVYLNRLRLGMALQADPTVKYAVGDFGLRRILNRHLTTESPFNTYLHTGLPPAPICLPGKSSIGAVLHAEETSYLYFCASDALDGTHRFATTLKEHNRNAAAYHAALTRRGIK